MTEQQEAAMRMALEALEQANSLIDGYYQPVESVNEAIAALTAALADNALNKMAENAREIGLDYEPAQQEIDWKDQYEKQKRRADMWVAKYEADIGPLEKAGPVTAQQEPVDKNGSPCPEFWDWLPKAYNFEGVGVFTKYNMEVAFLAGKQSVAISDTSSKQEPVAWVNWCAATGKRSVSFECESELASEPLYAGITQNTQGHYSKFHSWFYSAPHRAKYGTDHPAYLAAQEAWDASGDLKKHNYTNGYCTGRTDLLAEQKEQEKPVAWMTINAYGEEDDIHYENPEGHLLYGWTYKPLYTHPAREPLTFDGMTAQEFALKELYAFQEATGCDTADQIKAREPLTVDELWQNDQLMSLNAELGCSMDLLMEVVRAIEAAHGITGEKK